MWRRAKRVPDCLSILRGAQPHVLSSYSSSPQRSLRRRNLLSTPTVRLSIVPVSRQLGGRSSGIHTSLAASSPADVHEVRVSWPRWSRRLLGLSVRHMPGSSTTDLRSTIAFGGSRQKRYRSYRSDILTAANPTPTSTSMANAYPSP